MTEFIFGGYIAEVDEAVTSAWYAKSDGWDCSCGHCRNFLELARRNELPAIVTEHLQKLKIPPEKATYVCEIFEDEDGLYYQFSYRLAGRFLNGRQEKEDSIFCGHEPYPYGAPGFPEPHFDLEFWMKLPWILEED